MSGDALYTLEPLLPHFGAVIRDFDLNGPEPLSAAVVARIKDDMRKHRVLVFKGAKVSGARQVQISQQLGEIESTFYKHPASPHPDIFRVSNDEREGCTGVGRTGWHIDGTFQPMPFKFQTMHFHSVYEGGETWFLPLKELYEAQDDATRSRWDKLWMVTGRSQFAHPLVYKHPVRGDTTLMFHCGEPFCSGWLEDSDEADPTQRKPSKFIDSHVIQSEISDQAYKHIDTIGVKMTWEVGDFAINDNLGNCHYAPPGTQNARKISGLRILHRTTIAGERMPEKADGRRSFMVN